MRNDPTNPDPSPEELAAFLDGELDGAARSHVEAWLSSSPDAAAEIDGQQRLARLWRDNPPPEPSAGAWAATLTRIEARLPVPVRRPRRLPRVLWLCVGAAAAVLAVVVVGRAFLPGALPRVEKVDPLPVVEPGDVTIISMDARDADALVVAVPPIQPPLLAAGQDDVSVMDMEPYWKDEGQVPQIGEGEVPMITAPLIARVGGR